MIVFDDVRLKLDVVLDENNWVRVTQFKSVNGTEWTTKVMSIDFNTFMRSAA